MKLLPTQMLSLGLISALLLAPVPAMANDGVPENTLQVQGTGQVTAKPDAVSLSVTVETEARTLEEARNQNAQKMSRVTQAIKTLGIPNLVLKTSYYNVYPIRKKEDRSPSSYRANNSLSLKLEGVTDSDRLAKIAGQLMDTAMGAGANSVHGPNFYLSENNDATQDALKLAVAQARRTADTLAQAAGITIVGVHNIETYSHGTPMKALGGAPMAMRADAESVATPLEAGEFDVTANVTIRFDFRD